MATRIIGYEVKEKSFSEYSNYSIEVICRAFGLHPTQLTDDCIYWRVFPSEQNQIIGLA